MTVQEADFSHYPALSALWSRCFSDSAQEAEAFLRHFAPPVFFLGNPPSAMAVSLPYNWQGKQAAYLYAVCTDSDFRGQGLCRRLMKEAEGILAVSGVSYATLVPGSQSLFSFYETLGYETVFFHRVFSAAPGNPDSVTVLSPEDYGALRSLLPELVQMPTSVFLYAAGFGAFYRLPCGIAYVEQGPQGPLCKELLSERPAEDGSALCAYLKLPSLQIRTPGSERPFGMAKSLDGSPLISSYLGLALD